MSNEFSPVPFVEKVMKEQYDEIEEALGQVAVDLTGWGDPRSDDFGDIMDSHDSNVWDSFVSHFETDWELLQGESDTNGIESWQISGLAESAVNAVAEDVYDGY